MRGTAALALLLSVAAASPCARADDVPLDPEARIEEARAEFARGRRDFARERFEDALAHFERSHRLTASPDLVYNIALTLDRLGRRDAAIARYERYLELRPGAAEGDYVRERIAALEAASAEAEAGTDGADPSPDDSPTEGEDAASREDGGGAPAAGVDDDASGGGPGAGPWILVGVGGAAALGGTAALLVDDGDRGALGGALIGVGAAAVIGGVIWAVVGGGGGDAGGDEAHVRVTPTLGGVLVHGRF